MKLPPVVGISMLDFDTKKAVLSACAIEVVLLLIAVVSKVFGVIMLAIFAVLGVVMAISIFSKKKESKEDAKGRNII